MIGEAQNKEQRHNKNNQRDNFAQEVRNRRLLAPFKVNSPTVTIDQRDDQRCAEQYSRVAAMPPPRRLQSVDSQRNIECKRETEKLIQNSEANFGAPFQKSPKA